MKKLLYAFLSVMVLATMTGCEAFLTREDKTSLTDETYWKNADNIRLFVNGAYENYFVGYNSGWTGTHAPSAYNNNGAEYSDDASKSGAQPDICNQVPDDNWFRTEGVRFLPRRGSTGWDFSYIRKWNILIDRIEANKDSYSASDYEHWMGIARFFRAYEYSLLVMSFGDVPYFDKPVSDTDRDAMFKDRDPRIQVMKKAVEDFDYAVEHIRTNDGENYVNRYVAATMASRCMLFEGTWYIYHKNDEAMKTCGTAAEVSAAAQTFLEKARDYAQIVIDSNNYQFDVEFNALFGSYTKPGHEVLLYREYSDALAVRHCTASYCNLREGQCRSANLSTLKAWLCNDGKPYSTSTVANADSFVLDDMVASRDPRFEATFNQSITHLGTSTGIYTIKFVNREAPTLWADDSNTNRPEYRSNTNVNGYPCVRYAETVLNWIEAKAELADKFGGAAVTQADLDKSINAIRNRPIAPEAAAKGVKKTADLKINAIPDDPARTSAIEAATHAGVVSSPLIWEIRRERRMEFFAEHYRSLDIRRWGKLELMQGTTNPDILLGAWLNLADAEVQAQRPFLTTVYGANALKVKDNSGNIITYDGTNKAAIKGYLLPSNVTDRGPLGGEKQYLEPICNDVMSDYLQNGFKITQNPGWESL
ncbi:MAG: RagB/SusD family nutrient uptake outer membrane protein [Bacteroidales bacterium]|nr:RagB/SusD family nutrient uptake outer membrane protein [Bacteroidales bacterium]